MAIRDRIPNGVGMEGDPALLQMEEGPDGEPRISKALVSLLNLFQQRIVSKINGRLSFGNGDHATQSGNIDGQWIEMTTPSANVEFAVDHGLDRLPAGYIVMRRDRVCTIYDSNVGGWNERRIYLKCDVDTAVVRLLIV